jgi:hypothetical protein
MLRSRPIRKSQFLSNGHGAQEGRPFNKESGVHRLGARMTKVFNGYAKTKVATSLLLDLSRSPLVGTNAPLLLAVKRDV